MTHQDRATILRKTRDQLRSQAPTAWRLVLYDEHGTPHAIADRALLELAAMLEESAAAAWLDAKLETESLRQRIGDWLPEHYPPPHLAAVIEAVQTAGAIIYARALERANEKAALVTRFDPPIAQAIAASATKTARK